MDLITQPTNMQHLASQLVDACNAHDTIRLSALFAPDCRGEDVSQKGLLVGHNAVRESVEGYIRAFPDFHMQVNDLVVQGEKAVIVWTAMGTHRGTMMSIPPTGRAVCVRGTTLITARDGKVAETLTVWDVAAMLRDLGLLPEL